MRSTSETTFDSGVSFQVQTTTIFSVLTEVGPNSTVTTQSKHIGACKPGMRLGDYTSGPPGGLITVNILDIVSAQKKMK